MIVPPSRPIPPKITERQVPCDELEPLCRGSFPVRRHVARLSRDSRLLAARWLTPRRLLRRAPTSQGYVTLNRIQSIVYPTAYKTNENMLVCAPTGAGKTDVAMLSILRTLSQHLLPPMPGSRTPDVPRIAKDQFKIIYVAPMKALAAEVVRKFGKRLAWIGIQVRELTGASPLPFSRRRERHEADQDVLTSAARR